MFMGNLLDVGSETRYIFLDYFPDILPIYPKICMQDDVP